MQNGQANSAEETVTISVAAYSKLLLKEEALKDIFFDIDQCFLPDFAVITGIHPDTLTEYSYLAYSK